MMLVGALLLPATAALAQTGQITGRVIEAQTTRPLSGATVTVVGTDQRAVTGPNGTYVIAGVPAGSRRVTATMMGYGAGDAAVMVNAGQAATVNFELSPVALALDEIVAVGYGTQRRRDLTGAVASVPMAAVEQRPIVSVDQMLQGTAPGVQVSQASSAPGGGISIRVRGGTSVTEGVSNEPLYVIDGFPIEVDYGADNAGLSGGRTARITVPSNPLTTLNPRDIESIEILKDASATAIYGSRAANGVVLITTKQGQAGAPKVNFEAFTGIQNVAKRYDLLTGPEFAVFANEWAATTRPELGLIYEDPSAVASTDWQDAIFRQAPLQSYQLSVSGGTSGANQTRYAVSGGYFEQEGVVLGSEFERMSLRLNLTQTIKERLRLGTTLTGSRVLTNFAPTEGAAYGQDASVVAAALQAIPALPIRRPDGSYTVQQLDAPIEITPGEVANPVAVLTHMDDVRGESRILTNSFAEYDLTDDLKFRTTLGANVTNRQRDTYWPRETFRGAQAGGQAIRGRNESLSIVNENTISYNRTFADIHALSGVVGYTRQWQDGVSTSLIDSNFLDDLLGFHAAGQGNPPGGADLNSSATETRLASYLGRVNYNLMGRYLFTLTGRYDGSSRFGPDRKWGFFPSAAVAWRASEEPFLADVDQLSELKVRASYGATGNAAVSPYRSLARLGDTRTNFGPDIVSGFRQVELANPELGWETTYQFDAGVDLGVLDNRVRLTADYYNRRTEDLLMQVALPLESGFQFAWQNAGTVRNRGFELALGVTPLEGNGFETPRWSNNFNYSRNRNVVLDLGGVDILPVRGVSANFNFPGSDIRLGLPIGVFFGYQTNGLFQDSVEAANWATLGDRQFRAGEARVLDLDGNGVINELDRTIIGDPNPDYTLGWTSNFAWRGFELTSLLNGSFGADVLNLNLIRVESGGPSTNITRERFLERWTPENPNARFPRIGFTAGSIGSNYVDTMLEDGSYLRLSNVTLGYNLPAKFVARRGFRDMRLYVTGNNLYTWSDYSGYNPDVNSMGVSNTNRGIDIGSYPLARTFTVGVNVGY